MKALDFKWTSDIGSAFLLTGSDGYWKDYVINVIKNSVANGAFGYNYRVYNELKSIEEALEAFSSVGFFGESSIVVISNYGVKKSGAKSEAKLSAKEVELWHEVIASLSPELILIVVDSNLPKEIAQKFFEVDCSKLEGVALKDHVSSLATPKKIEPRALDILIEYCNRDMLLIANEVKKLSAYAGGKNTLTVEMVETLVANNIENEMFELSNAIADKNKIKATKLFDKFVSKGISYSLMLGMLVNQYRRLLHCALSKKSDNDLAESLGIKPYAVKRSRETATKYGKATLKSILDGLVDAEFAFKSGVMVEETAVRTAFAKLISK